MRILKARYCMQFSADRIFASVRSKLAERGINWNTVLRNPINPDEHREHFPEIDQAFYNNDRFEIVLDGRGYTPKHVKCVIAQDLVEIVAERETKAGHMSLIKKYPPLPRQWDSNSGDCCMSTEGIILVTGAWI
ncbi:unnamed protein product [Brassicogethes aeneus]|uniref:Uncharacterized protein n=1 Tax=Brassicogethes aeneus TaxID=1431903 RepID=A0A9P0FPU3_BRAAE|nr:unnamed protein product [Brassicogethes aeneus]